jgi:hypothetical protein
MKYPSLPIYLFLYYIVICNICQAKIPTELLVVVVTNKEPIKLKELWKEHGWPTGLLGGFLDWFSRVRATAFLAGKIMNIYPGKWTQWPEKPEALHQMVRVKVNHVLVPLQFHKNSSIHSSVNRLYSATRQLWSYYVLTNLRLTPPWTSTIICLHKLGQTESRGIDEVQGRKFVKDCKRYS